MQDRFIIVSGLSGAGKTVALHALEDAGFYCVDNLPAGFLAEFAEFIAQSDLPAYRQVAVGIDARNPAVDLGRLPGILDALKQRLGNLELVFVEAGDQALINRFSETRRRHPLTNDDTPLRQAIAAERALLEPIIARAELRIDTSHSRLHEFRALVNERIVKRQPGSLAVQFCSFGYKNGVPPDADFVFDVRCLPNPYWEPQLRGHSGRDEPVACFLEATPAVAEMIADVVGFLEKWIPRFEQDQRSYLTVAIGCTGGRHRSVYIAERLAAHFKPKRRIVLNHRDG